MLSHDFSDGAGVWVLELGGELPTDFYFSGVQKNDTHLTIPRRRESL